MIKSQRYTNYEIIVVDSGSVDRTRQVAEVNGARVIRLRPDDFTFGHSLNVGIDASRGIFVCILSGHAIPTDDRWLERLIEPLRDPDIPMTYGGQRGHRLSKYSESRDFERVYDETTRRLRAPHYFANNANSAIRKDAWMQHRFDEGLTGLEDICWAKHWMDLGKTVAYEARACIWHIHTETWPQVRRRYHREAVAAHAIGLLDQSHSFREIRREVRWCASDLLAAWRDSRLVLVGGEVLRFRWEKTMGILAGIRDGRNFMNLAVRAEMFFDKTYPAVVIRSPGVAELEARLLPLIKPGEILIRVAFQGICHTDLEIFDGTLGYYRSGLAKYPIVPGHECAGTVAAVGARVTDFVEHDRVVVECIQGCGECAHCERDNAIACESRREVGVIGHDGGYAAFLVTRARFAHRIPSNVTLAQAALVEPIAVVTKGLRRLAATSAGNDSARRCLVMGAGTIGHLAARMLASGGHDVTIVDRDSSRLTHVSNGAVRTATSVGELKDYEWLVEASGNQESLELLLNKSSTGATVLLLGLPYATQPFSFETIVGFDRTVVGSVGSSSRDFDEALRLLPTFNTTPFLQSKFPLEQFSDAWAAVRSRRHLKVMLRVDPTAL